MEKTLLRVDRTEDGAVVALTLNRPESRNALNQVLARALLDACTALATDDATRVVIVTGAGDRAFCAGADLTERHGLTGPQRAAHTELISRAADALAGLPMPTIAAIRGYAVAGGAELAIACDLRVAGDDAVLGFPEVKIGIFPGAGGAVRLPALVGSGAARDLLFSGRFVPADEAMRLGLLDRLVEPKDVLDCAMELAHEMASNAPLAIRA
ncbi:MAG: enoyl-CoA hydratase-related protein, partial [Chloroflexota bacterium]|nr:enoyl-CoA hydratase-related protein [Chloroflexota bacterium]